MGFGEPSELHRRLCPETAKALDTVPKLQTACFSGLGPGKHVPRHRGGTKGLVRCHLGLEIPGDKQRCRMEVGDESFSWEERKWCSSTTPSPTRSGTRPTKSGWCCSSISSVR